MSKLVSTDLSENREERCMKLVAGNEAAMLIR